MTIQANMLSLPEYTRQSITGIPATGLNAGSGSSQTTAVLIPSDFNVYTTVASTNAVILPWGVDGTTAGPVQIGDTITTVNHGANPLLVYPQSGGKIQNGSANADFSVTNNKTCEFFYIGGGNWGAALGN